MENYIKIILKLQNFLMDRTKTEHVRTIERKKMDEFLNKRIAI